MPQHPLHFQSGELPGIRAAEAAARRRLRGLEKAYPAARAWQVNLEPLPLGPQPASYAVHVSARICGGEVVRAQARDEDPLSAMWLAFNALESALDGELERARGRAAHWLRAVRRWWRALD